MKTNAATELSSTERKQRERIAQLEAENKELQEEIEALKRDLDEADERDLEYSTELAETVQAVVQKLVVYLDDNSAAARSELMDALMIARAKDLIPWVPLE